MTVEIKMPALSPTMEKGTLARWLVGLGDMVRAGDMLAEIETDKATMEMEAAEDGRIASIVVPEGSSDVAVGTVIALLGDGGGEEVVAPPVAVPAEPSVEVVASRQPEVVAAARLPADTAEVTPLARRIAGARRIDLAAITGSGPRGRIVMADLNLPGLNLPGHAAVPIAAKPAAVPEPVFGAPPEGVPVRTEALSTMRRTIARRLTQSKQTVPHFYLTVRCNLDPLLRLRGAINETLADRGIRVSVNDLLVKAMARALEQVPEANVQFAGEHLHRFERVDIAMAVAIEGGLVTPVIRDVGVLSPAAIAQASKALSARAREGRLTPQDYQGGTATISNLGMFGIDEMVPVINPPQAMILGIGAGIEMPWKVDGEVALATVMAATGSFDHRAIDGAVAARFMAALRELVEAPMLIVA